jgi:hypothetical protein
MPKGNCPLEDFRCFKRLFLDGSTAAERKTSRIPAHSTVLICLAATE